jgi:hypothetical protein
MEDLEQIKRAVSARPVYEPIAAEPLPHDIIDLERMIKESPRSAPLFIKIDKYKEILSNISELKSSLSKLMDMVAIRKKIHQVNFETDERLEKALQKISSSTSDFTNEFVKLRGVDHFVNEAPKKAEDVVMSRLGDEIMRLKEELDALEI